MRPLEKSLEKLDDVRKKKLSEMIGSSGGGSTAVSSSGLFSLLFGFSLVLHSLVVLFVFSSYFSIYFLLQFQFILQEEVYLSQRLVPIVVKDKCLLKLV
jgi:hypothetical protein